MTWTYRRTLTLTRVVILAVVMGGFVGSKAYAQSGRVLFADDFDANTNGWRMATSNNGTVTVEGGALTLKTTVAGQAAWITPAASVPDDIDLTVEARVQNPAANGEWNFAVLLRADARTTQSAFYHFGITGLGNWEFRGRPKDADIYSNSIDSGAIPDFDAAETFKIAISARGSEFTFSINGREVGKFADNLINSDPESEKYIGLMSGTYENASENTVVFQNLRVTDSQGGQVLIGANFADPNPDRWTLGKTTDSDAYFDAGALVVEVNKANVIRWSRSEQPVPPDVDVSVRAQGEGEGMDWGMGLGVRAQFDGQDLLFYLLELRGSGDYTFTTQRGGNVLKTLKRGTIAGLDPTAPHLLRIVAKGDDFTLYIDGRELDTISDSSMTPQTEYFILLSGGTFTDSASMTVRYTDLAARPAAG